MNDARIELIIKSILYLSISLFLLLSAYCAFMMINDWVAESIDREVQEVLATRDTLTRARADTLVSQQEPEVNVNAKLKKWTWDYSRDVGVMDEKYPLVVLRTGFKVIQTYGTTALVGWKMDVLNTSKKHSYYPEVEYFITDIDDFRIGLSTNEGNLPAESFGSVQGTMSIPISDLERIVSSTLIHI